MLALVIGCVSTQAPVDDRLTTTTDPTGFDDKIVVELSICESREYEFIWASGTENVLVVGKEDDYCKFKLTSDIKGRGSTWDCMTQPDGRFVVTQSGDSLPTYSHVLSDVCTVSDTFSEPDTN